MFPLEKTTLELKFSAMETACCSTMHVCFTHCVVRTRFDASPRREAISHRVNLFREMLQVVDRIVTKGAHFVSGMFMIRSLALTHAPS